MAKLVTERARHLVEDKLRNTGTATFLEHSATKRGFKITISWVVDMCGKDPEVVHITINAKIISRVAISLRPNC